MNRDRHRAARVIAWGAFALTACSQPPQGTPTGGVGSAGIGTMSAAPHLRLTRAEAHARLWPVPAITTWQAHPVTVHQQLARLIETLAERAAGDGLSADLVSQAQAIGMVLETWTVDEVEAIVLLEPATPTGLGSYAFRRRPTGQVVVQAPHAYFDTKTGSIAAALFWTGPASVLMTNNIHRYAQADGVKEARDHNPADITHEPAHAFVLASGGLATRATAVVQLHGFDGEASTVRQAVDAIISTGDRRFVDSGAARLADRWSARATVRLGRYGVDVDELGGTRNAAGTAVRDAGGQFIHLECSQTLRAALAEDVTALADALVEALAEATPP